MNPPGILPFQVPFAQGKHDYKKAIPIVENETLFPKVSRGVVKNFNGYFIVAETDGTMSVSLFLLLLFFSSKTPFP